jgi:tetratricopeptide (TPR) repeat protein
MTSRPLAAFLLAALCLTAAPRARADEVSDFEKGRAAYSAKNYDDADRRFHEMLDAQKGSLRDPALISEARMYLGAVLFAKAQTRDAAAVFEKLLLEKPEYEPDPLRFPQDVVNFFIDTRHRIIEKLNEAKAARAKQDKERRDAEIAAKQRQEARLVRLEQMAAEEITVEHHSRLFALLPFGAGQFQNGDKVLGFTLLGLESSLFLAGSVTFPVYRVQLANASQSFSQGQSLEAQQWLDRANKTRVANLVLFGVFAATAVVGVLQSEIAFVPESVEIKKRAIPPVGRLTPFAAPLVGDARDGREPNAALRGGIVGVSGTFE